MANSSVAPSKLHFVQQQGFPETDDEACAYSYPALMFQPRLVGTVVAVGLLTQYAPLFLLLSAVLWWNVLLPRYNPVDALYNALVSAPRGLPRLEPAPPPRRTAQAMAAAFMLAIGATLAVGLFTLSYVLQVMMTVALVSLVFGKFCLGSYLYYLVKGEKQFAKRTLPWAK